MYGSLKIPPHAQHDFPLEAPSWDDLLSRLTRLQPLLSANGIEEENPLFISRYDLPPKALVSGVGEEFLAEVQSTLSLIFRQIVGNS